MKQLLRNWLFLFVVSGLVLIIDQVTKTLVVNNLAMYESYQPIPAISDFFQITRSYNTGAAFGIFSNAGDLFMIVIALIIVGMLFFYPRLPQGMWVTRFAVGMVLGGAVGNLIDRLQYGHVVDFIHYRIPDIFSNVSNLADHAIVLGVIIIFIDSWLSDRRANKDAEADSTQPATDQPDNA